MPLIEEKYDQHKIDSLKRYLQREADKDRKKDYEIIVDGFKVVSRTDNVDEFEDYEQEIKDNTRNISILIYDGGSTNRNTRYSFALNRDSTISEQPVNGVGGVGEIDQMIQQRLEEKDKQYELKSLNEKLAATEAKLEDAEEYQEGLETEVEQLKEQVAQLKEQVSANKFNLGSLNLVELGSEVLKHTLSKNAGKSPMAASLAGILGALNPPAEPKQAAEPEGEVSFHEQTETDHPQLTEHQMLILKSVQQMEQVLNGEQLLTMNHIIISLMQHPEQLMPVAELLNVQIPNSNEQV